MVNWINNDTQQYLETFFFFLLSFQKTFDSILMIIYTTVVFNPIRPFVSPPPNPIV